MTSTDDFSAWTKAVQARTEAALDRWLPSAGMHPTRLHEAMRYAVLGGGKRVRPLLCHAAGELMQALPEVLDRAACSLEMVHAYSLVHDDLPCMDDDALRRGKPTVHVQYDEATALLVGDALLTQAFILLSEPVPALAAGQTAALVHELALASGSLGMAGGQAIDLESVGKRLTRDQLEMMHRMKTGALLRASVRMGAGCGRALVDDEAVALDAYASAIGLAFQVVDDILDATTDSATLGKTAGKDAANDKPTYVSLLGLADARVLAEDLRRDAHAAIRGFGSAAARLRSLADLVVDRIN
ncbi:polyprenyl synthetase family protein [Pandoraea sp.]|uniref:polyprenyl synthetase family protein n=1 Tax=Pandoraea sp. TaxID=1883445 RepID=UPI0011F91AF8|nr:farnesyl diphosphate synthase [Pandoraea sp.]TAL57095.1 MAG: polyprenyl synthetase family protein [Pandoraea sp.]TAM18137.1 MAG: polyprenyl synthetase family protein [Pandoraea sp.]